MSGPPPGAGCTVCEHPDAAIINQAINAGRESNRKVATRFGVSKDAVNRHVFRRHRGLDPRVGSKRGVRPDEGATEIDRLKLIREQLEQDMAERARPETSRELRQVNERISVLEGTDRPKSVTVADVQGFPEQLARWFQALEPFPEARQAMMEATDPALLEASGVTA